MQIIMHVQIGIGPDPPDNGACRMAVQIEGGCRVQETRRYIVGWARRAGVVMPMRLADVGYVVMMLIASFETLLPLDVFEDLEIHAEDWRVLRHVANDRNRAAEEGGEVGLGEPGIAG